MVDVIGVGLPRTGTLSLKMALGELGFGPCCHMSELLRRPRLAAGWLEAAQGKPVDWATVLSGYRSTVDWPGAAFWRELTTAYPDAKVILTVRDPNQWYASMELLVHGGRSMRVLTSPAVRTLAPSLATVAQLIEALVGRQYGITPEHMRHGRMAKEPTLDAFIRHNSEVLATIPAERLLVFRVEEGWEPLCEFLGCELPVMPFPHANEAGRFHRDTWRRLAPAYGRSALVLAGAAAGTALAAGLAVRRMRARQR